MRQATLSSVTLQTLENYRHAAHLTTRAYRAGTGRLITAVNGSLEQRVDPRTRKFAPGLTDRMQALRGRVSDLTVKGVDQVSSLAEAAVEIGTDGAARQVQRLAEFAASVQTPMLATGLETAARLSLPPAEVALALSRKVNQGAMTLSQAAQGKQPLKARAKKARSAAASKAQRVQRKASQVAKAVEEVVQEVAAPAAPTPRKAPTPRPRRKAVAAGTVAAAVEAV